MNNDIQTDLEYAAAVGDLDGLDFFLFKAEHDDTPFNIDEVLAVAICPRLLINNLSPSTDTDKVVDMLVSAGADLDNALELLLTSNTLDAETIEIVARHIDTNVERIQIIDVLLGDIHLLTNDTVVDAIIEQGWISPSDFLISAAYNNNRALVEHITGKYRHLAVEQALIQLGQMPFEPDLTRAIQLILRFAIHPEISAEILRDSARNNPDIVDFVNRNYSRMKLFSPRNPKA